MTVFACIGCRQSTPYRGVGQYFCPNCRNTFLARWGIKPNAATHTKALHHAEQ